VATGWPLAARAQQSQKAPRIGVLLPGSPTSFSVRANAFLEGLRDLGYVEGRTIAIEWKWAEDQIERFPELAAELVRANVDVIVTDGTSAATALADCCAIPSFDRLHLRRPQVRRAHALAATGAL
jgi:putative tryptophan/tyrosine transport system substrate-binding protein